MTSTATILAAKQLADQVRSAADNLAKAINAAKEAGLTVDVGFIREQAVGLSYERVHADVRVARVEPL